MPIIILSFTLEKKGESEYWLSLLKAFPTTYFKWSHYCKKTSGRGNVLTSQLQSLVQQTLRKKYLLLPKFKYISEKSYLLEAIYNSWFAIWQGEENTDYFQSLNSGFTIDETQSK